MTLSMLTYSILTPANDIQHNNYKTLSIMLLDAECLHAICRHVVCRHAECRGAFLRILSLVPIFVLS